MIRIRSIRAGGFSLPGGPRGSRCYGERQIPKGVAIETSLGWLTADAASASGFLDCDSVVSVAERADLAPHTPSPPLEIPPRKAGGPSRLHGHPVGNQTRSHVGTWRPAARQRQRVGTSLRVPLGTLR